MPTGTGSGTTELYAWRGRQLRVDLTSRSWAAEEISPEALKAYLGGRGFGAWALYSSGRHMLDPLHPDAPLIFCNGPLTGTRAPTSSRTSLTALSPLTGTIFDSNSGGLIGIRLKQAGYDALWIEGKADQPIYISVTADEVRFEAAEHLWGQGTRATRERLSEAEGAKVATACIGPAGESLSWLANIAHGARFFGRGGLGAVMGSKNLKAVAIHGDLPVTVADRDGYRFVVDECRKWLHAHPVTGKGLPQFGTAVLMNVINAVGALPARNFRDSQFGRAERLCGEALRDQLLEGQDGCPNCPIRCGRKIRLDGETVEGPEFETLWSLGADLGLDDLEWVARLNRLANDLGMDTISAGSTVAAARELFEAGVLQWDALEGGGQGISRVLSEMAWNRGLGAALRHGSRALAESVNAPWVAMASKGLELPAYDPRGCQGQGLAYATSNRGGCHLRAYMVAPEILATPKLIDRFSSSGKGGLAIVQQNLNAAVDSLVLCRFTSFGLKDDYYARLLRTATGIDFDAQELLTVGERIYNLERCVNNERGLTRADDTLPERLRQEPVAAGPSAGHRVQLEVMLDEYYRFRGWDDAGHPREGKLRELGIMPPERLPQNANCGARGSNV